MASIKSSRLTILGSHASAWLTLVLVIVHQGFIASSAYFLTNAIKDLQAGRPFEISLILYFVSMILPFAPGCLSYVTMQFWANAAHARLVALFKNRFLGQTAVYRSQSAKEKIDSIISRNSFSTIFGYVGYIHGFVSFSLNSILSLLVIACLLPSGIWEGYLISVIACAAVIAAITPGISKLSNQSQEELAGYGQLLGKIWVNTTLGNALNFKNWDLQTKKRGGQYYKSLIKLAWAKQFGNFFLGLVTLIPTAYLVYSTVTAPAVDATLVAAIIVNLTRVFHILNSLGSLVYQFIEFGAVDASFKFLLNASKLEYYDTPKPEINSIRVNGLPVDNYAVAASRILTASNGRFTVRGANGSGKTAFLLTLKTSDPQNSFYLPASVESLMWSETRENLSTGERILSALMEIQKMGEIKVLLLDEWDANLDQQNTDKTNAFLDELAAQKVIVEIRH